MFAWEVSVVCCLGFTWRLVTDLSVSFGREGTDDVAPQPRAQTYPHHPVGALRILAQARVDLEPTSRHQSSALVGPPFRTANVSDPVTSGGRPRYREQAMHPGSRGRVLLYQHQDIFKASPRKCVSESAGFSYAGAAASEPRQGSGTSQQGAASHQGPGARWPPGGKPCFLVPLYPWVGFLPSLFLSSPLSCLMQTVLVCFPDLSFLLKCLSALYPATPS